MNQIIQIDKKTWIITEDYPLHAKLKFDHDHHQEPKSQTKRQLLVDRDRYLLQEHADEIDL